MAKRAAATTPTSETALLGLVNDIYAAPLDPELWPGVIRRIVDGARGASGQLVSPSERALTNLWVPHGFGHQEMAPYAAYYHEVDVWTQGIAAQKLPPCTVLTGEQMVDDRTFFDSEYYNDFLKQNGFERLVACFVATGEQGDLPRTSLSVYRPPGAEPFDQASVDFLSAVVPHVRRAVQLHWHIADLRQRADTAVEVLDHLSTGVVLVDEDAHPLFLNRAAEHIVQRSDGIAVAAGTLVAMRPGETATLSRIVDEAIHPLIAGNRAHACTAVVTRRDSRLPYRVTAIPLRGDRSFRTGHGRAAAIVFIADAPASFATGVSTLTMVFGLTRAEARLVEELASGRPLKTAASELGISVNTAHAQLSAVFQKTDTHRQAELLQLVGALAGSDVAD
ncbi:MAG: hypothetical protein GC151_08340 [Betaproteobacteria bacterium]|nr:hypothetical protein [Betaproteobacteria bacterium]